MSEPEVGLLLRSSAKALAEDPKEARARFQEAARANADPCPSCGKVIIHRKGLGWCQDQEMSEATLQERVIGRAKRKGWAVAHAGRGFVGGDEHSEGRWITPMAKGWPDLTLAKIGHRLIFIELKREVGVVEPEQLVWLQLLNQTGNFAIVIRPHDLREKRVNAILAAGAPL